MAHISVYSGMACDQLECLAASEKDCKVTWFGEEGIKYNIRVHGLGASVGNFGLSVAESDFGTKECEVAKQVFETNPDMTTSCKDCEAPDSHGHVHLHCSIGCTTCDETGSVCANRTASSKFGKAGQIVTTKQHYQYTMGRAEYLTVKKYHCTGEENCELCEVAIDEVVCDSCAIVDCGAGLQGVDAVCGNATINTCDEDAADEMDSTDIFHPLLDVSYDTCFSREASVACSDHLNYEQNLDDKILCECQEVGDDLGDFRLVCQRQDCLQCNPERTICGFEAFGSIFDSELGRLTRTFEGFQFVEGRTDLVAHHTTNDMFLTDDQTNCMVTVNDDACDTCVAHACSSNEGQGVFHGFTFDCQNLNNGIFYDGCSPIGLSGLFEFVNSPSFQVCVDVVGAREACETTLLETMTGESSSSLENLCGCHETENGGYELVCTDMEDCQLCSDRSETAICADYSEYRVEINQFGSFVAHSDTFQYTQGRDEVLVIHDNDYECQVTIDGEPCASCNYAECSDIVVGRHSLSIDCSNLLGENATYECGNVDTDEGHEIFTAISSSSEYVCASDTASPTATPTSAPTTASPTELPTVTPPKSGASRTTRSPLLLLSAALSVVCGLSSALLW